uniref:Uncharacterized protein n=1 Tax=Anopheles albimanus TaxID=7167 RepID=A0A182FZA2_ANOAL
ERTVCVRLAFYCSVILVSDLRLETKGREEIGCQEIRKKALGTFTSRKVVHNSFSVQNSKQVKPSKRGLHLPRGIHRLQTCAKVGLPTAIITI